MAGTHARRCTSPQSGPQSGATRTIAYALVATAMLTLSGLTLETPSLGPTRAFAVLERGGGGGAPPAGFPGWNSRPLWGPGSRQAPRYPIRGGLREQWRSGRQALKQNPDYRLYRQQRRTQTTTTREMRKQQQRACSRGGQIPVC